MRWLGRNGRAIEALRPWWMIRHPSRLRTHWEEEGGLSSDVDELLPLHIPDNRIDLKLQVAATDRPGWFVSGLYRLSYKLLSHIRGIIRRFRCIGSCVYIKSTLSIVPTRVVILDTKITTSQVIYCIVLLFRLLILYLLWLRWCKCKNRSSYN